MLLFDLKITDWASPTFIHAGWKQKKSGIGVGFFYTIFEVLYENYKSYQQQYRLHIG